MLLTGFRVVPSPKDRERVPGAPAMSSLSDRCRWRVKGQTLDVRLQNRGLNRVMLWRRIGTN
jgi:hypothetical protein